MAPTRRDGWEAGAHGCAAVLQNWPSAGRVSLENVSMRYRDDLPLVLHDVTFQVEPAQKVAIVGRTAAGKVLLCTVFVVAARVH